MESSILGVILDSSVLIDAELVGKINAESAQRGITIPFDDLLIGACALERGFAVATHNERHFKKIPDLTILSL